MRTIVIGLFLAQKAIRRTGLMSKVFIILMMAMEFSNLMPQMDLLSLIIQLLHQNLVPMRFFGLLLNKIFQLLLLMVIKLMFLL